MVHKLPWWVGLGGTSLAFIAGVVNAVGFESFAHEGVTHLTGAATTLGLAVGEGRPSAALHMLLVIASFGAGATMSGFLIHSVTLKLGRRYGLALTLESALLFAGYLLLRRNHVAGEYLAGAACGLQNAMASMYSGAILRTTHVTGIVTDLGVLLGHKLRGTPVEGRRVRLLLLIVAGFVGGAAAGALLFRRFDYGALLLPVVLTGGAGLLYGIARHRALAREKAAS
jgi:uncharacterized membrane protein YoaK (UPF0700 family)